MTKRDWKVALYGALCAFGVVAGNDGHVFAAAFFFAVGGACLVWAKHTDKGIKA